MAAARLAAASSSRSANFVSSFSITVLREAAQSIGAHAVRSLPLECCGALIGRGTSIERAEPARNVLESPQAFEIDPLDLMHIERQARCDGLSVLGYYHSHPDSAPLPSSADRRQLLWPDAGPPLHLIISPSLGWALYSMRPRPWTPISVTVR